MPIVAGTVMLCPDRTPRPIDPFISQSFYIKGLLCMYNTYFLLHFLNIQFIKLLLVIFIS